MDLASEHITMDLFRKKAILDTPDSGSPLAKCLTAVDLIFLGIGAIIGAGIFVLTGIVAANSAGPAIIFSYMVAGLACAFSALSYAELAASIGGCGSAYGYAYAGFGEFIAFIVGWDLILEYLISVPAVAAGWSGYCNNFLKALNLTLPDTLVLAPSDGGIFNLLAFLIIIIITILLILGVKSSSRINIMMVLLKLFVISLFIIIAFMNIQPSYWFPFMPFGWEGVMQGAALIFFAYIGFDAVSTAAEESIYPQRDLPVGIIGSLIFCTLIYILTAGLLTGIVHYTTLNVPSPISYALLAIGHKTAAGLISVGAIAGLSTVMLVLFYGQTRIIFALCRDGLLPRVLTPVHAIFHTPVRIIILCGLAMSLIAGLFPLHELAALVNIGTLFAFMTVCSGVILLHYRHPELPRPFRTPLMPYTPLLGILSCFYLILNLPTITHIRFIVWLGLGLIIYFGYSYRHSTLATKTHDNSHYRG